MMGRRLPGPGGQRDRKGSSKMPTNQILILLVMGAAFYFLLIRPQQQQAKRQAETIASLTPGAHILTIGGIYATVVSVGEDRVRIAVADGSELEIIKRAVGSVLPEDDEDSEADLDVDEDEPPMAELDESSDDADPADEGAQAGTSEETPTDA
jgi:preprotein translocase subunit YajC